MGKPKKNTNRDSISSAWMDTSINESNNDFDEVDIGNFSYRTGKFYLNRKIYPVQVYNINTIYIDLRR